MFSSNDTSGVALVVVHVAFPVEHLPRGQVIVDPFAAIGGNVRYALRQSHQWWCSK